MRIVDKTRFFNDKWVFATAENFYIFNSRKEHKQAPSTSTTCLPGDITLRKYLVDIWLELDNNNGGITARESKQVWITYIDIY